MTNSIEATFPPVDALCLGCNYPLRGLPQNRCPECGREFDPADTKTFNPGRAMGPVARWWLKPTGWWINVVAVLAGALLVAEWKWPSPSFSFGYEGSTDLRLPQWTGVYFEWFHPFGFAVWMWVWLLMAWFIFVWGRWHVVRRYRQIPEKLLADRSRRRFASWVFLTCFFATGPRFHQCPHASYYGLYDWGGIAHSSSEGAPCRNYAPSSVHLFGRWYLY